jgi:hypothetical protein
MSHLFLLLVTGNLMNSPTWLLKVAGVVFFLDSINQSKSQYKTGSHVQQSQTFPVESKIFVLLFQVDPSVFCK